MKPYVKVFFVLFIILLPIAFFAALLPIIVGGAANSILADTKMPDFEGNDREPPTTAGWQSYSSQDVQAIGGRGEKLSCSLHSFVEKLVFRIENQPIGLQMRQACITHDYCYRHGSATYGYGQEDCDFRLLRDVLRLCRYLSRPDEASQFACHEQAKKVVLGVRTFGSKSFLNAKDERLEQKPDDYPDQTSSTYFEYEPFPINSEGHWAMRIADPIGGRKVKGNVALYIFRVKPSGLRMTVEFDPEFEAEKGDSCNKYLLPTTSKWLTNAPMVLRRKIKIEQGVAKYEDLFVWFQRLSLNNSGSRFLALAPARATFKDWQKIFPGFRPDCGSLKGRAFNDHILTHLQPVVLSGESITSGFGNDTDPASAIFWTGNKKNSRYQNATSEFHPAPGFESADGTLRLMSLRTNSCIGDRTTLCFSDYSLSLAAAFKAERSKTSSAARSGLTLHPQEPLRVRDRLNEMGDGNEKMRYRNFSSPPFVIAGNSQSPVFSWLRRGTGKAGLDFDHRAEIRRMEIVFGSSINSNSNTGGNVGNLILEDFTEFHEPLMVVGRKSLNPSLVSLAFGKKNKAKGAYYWRLASPTQPNVKVANPPINIHRNSLSCIENEFDASWMYRPPVVVAMDDDNSVILFSRAEASVMALTVKPIKVSLDGKCKLLDKLTLWDIPERLNLGNFSSNSHSDSYEALRRVPLLAWLDGTKKEIKLVLPIKKYPVWTMIKLPEKEPKKK